MTNLGQRMTNKEYRDQEGISKSQLFNIEKSPFHFKYAMDHPQEDTKAMLFGRAAHKYILEQDKFFSEFAVAPDVDRRTKVGKDYYNYFLSNNAGKDIIGLAEYEIIGQMFNVIESNPDATALLSGIHEQSFFWTDEITGEKCKCRPDCITEYKGSRYIVDYKTTDSCEDGNFERSCRKYGYKLQAGMYTEGLFHNTLDEYGFAFVAQEKTVPYPVRIYICTPEYIAQGYEQFRELIGIYHDCKQSGNWYGYEGPDNLVTELLEEDY